MPEPDSRPGTRRPNVVVFLTDQQRWDTTGLAGCPLELTPNLDAMAREGAWADCAISPNPLCAPTRASLQTGQYPSSHGVWRNGIALDPDTPTLAASFAAAGYRTGYIGKWHLMAGAEAGPVPPADRGGYSSWLAANMLEFTSDAYRTIVFDDAEQPVELPGYRADALTDAAIRFVADHHDEPFLLFVSLLEPHQQNENDDCPAPLGYAERYAGRWAPPDLQALGGDSAKLLGGYFGQVKRVDECLGRLREALYSLGLTEKTVLAFTSDHGSHFRTRNAEFKRSCHDASMRVPLVLAGTSRRGRISRLVSLVDLPATLLAAAGIEIPATFEGRSLLDPDTDEPDETFSQLTEATVGRVLRTDRWTYCVEDRSLDPATTWRSPSYTETALYDLAHDPYQLANLVGNPRFEAVRAELRDRLLGWIKRCEDASPDITPAPVRRSRHRPEAHVRTRDLHPTRFGHQPAHSPDGDPSR